MARQWRIEYEGAFYHVLSRGNERREIFFDDEDRDLFLEILGKMAARFDIAIFAYVLMDNHYHLLLKTNKANISRAMQWLGTTYTRRFNLKNQRSGHLFQGRFKNFLVENEKYLVTLSCYIHRNPLRAGLVKRLAHYPWSSYPAYAYGKPCPCWLSPDAIIAFFSDKNHRHLYRKLVQDFSGEEKSLWEDFRHGLFFGSQEFVERIKTKYLPDRGISDVEVPQKKRVLREENIARLLERAAPVLGEESKDFVSRGKVRASIRDQRDLLIYFLWSTGWYSNAEIGNVFGLGFSSVSRRVSVIRSQMAENPGLREKLKNLNAIIKV